MWDRASSLSGGRVGRGSAGHLHRHFSAKDRQDACPTLPRRSSSRSDKSATQLRSASSRIHCGNLRLHVFPGRRVFFQTHAPRDPASCRTGIRRSIASKSENPLTPGIHAALLRGPLQSERWLSGRKQRFAKASYGLNRIEGSNPSLSATQTGKKKGSSLSVGR
jgi:hypothetical protein